MKRIATVGLLVVVVFIGAALLRHYLAVYGDVSLPSCRLSPTLPAGYEKEQNCELAQRFLAESPNRTPVLKRTPLTEDEVAIYKVVLKPWNTENVNLFDRTVPMPRDMWACECIEAADPESLVDVSQTSHVLSRHQLKGAKLTFVHLEQSPAIVYFNMPSDFDVNEGVFTLSEIAFDKEHRRALVSLGFNCAFSCENSRIWVLEKVDGIWRKSSDHPCNGPPPLS